MNKKQRQLYLLQGQLKAIKSVQTYALQHKMTDLLTALLADEMQINQDIEYLKQECANYSNKMYLKNKAKKEQEHGENC